MLGPEQFPPRRTVRNNAVLKRRLATATILLNCSAAGKWGRTAGGGVPAKRAAVDYESSAVGNAPAKGVAVPTVPRTAARGHICAQRAVGDRQRRYDGVGDAPAIGGTVLFETTGPSRIPIDGATDQSQLT